MMPDAVHQLADRFRIAIGSAARNNNIELRILNDKVLNLHHWLFKIHYPTFRSRAYPLRDERTLRNENTRDELHPFRCKAVKFMAQVIDHFFLGFILFT
jgi:hypothetical protein